MMLMAGTNITAAGDPLKKIHESYLFNSIRHPRPQLESDLRQLRIVYSLDSRQYAALKKNLPYFVCGIFSPPVRRKENFAYIDRFVIDIDGMAEKGLSTDEVKRRICSDDRVMMCFVSPSEDGLKVMFRLEERCYDQGIYTIFYKEFLRSFSAQYGLEQVVDSRTCDVSRACFISMDPDAYFNPEAVPVRLSAHVNPEDTAAFFDLIHEQARGDATPPRPPKASAPDNDTGDCPGDCPDSPAADTPDSPAADTSDSPAADLQSASRSNDPDDEVLEKIKARLNPRMARVRETRPVYVPEQIGHIMAGLKEYIKNSGLTLSEAISIQYGKKLRMSLGLKQAEVNIFFGRRGFSVVACPRCGTDDELNTLASELIRAYIDDMT